ncbi:hypothetical protein FIE12Z_5537 [Fusarium flagelliforme]|uniref:Uncharacterized protein n=1 Tax=Fusarium flagelliforme TaxID=2675880 RepID=A0A395MS26_9HYPO|nr:hypothetical protein FIE12Z_5537 [Fusarium flagelliforme]
MERFRRVKNFAKAKVVVYKLRAEAKIADDWDPNKMVVPVPVQRLKGTLRMLLVRIRSVNLTLGGSSEMEVTEKELRSEQHVVTLAIHPTPLEAGKVHPKPYYRGPQHGTWNNCHELHSFSVYAKWQDEQAQQWYSYPIQSQFLYFSYSKAF